MHDALVISDLHLGSDVCQARQLVKLLEDVHDGVVPTRRLILNGDVFDSIDFRRLRKQHWKVLSLLRKLSDDIEVVWIAGNHDDCAEVYSHLLGVTVRQEIAIESGGRRVLLLHGHRFDDFIERYPVTTMLADVVYRFLQWLDKTHYVARQAKFRSKMFLRCVRKVQDLATEYARRRGSDAVCCGHTHVAAAVTDGPVHYFNSGCWTELPCHYLTVTGGAVEVREFHDPTLETDTVEVPAAAFPTEVLLPTPA